VPLRALGQGASLPNPTSYHLALLRGVRIKGQIRDERPIGTTQSVPPLSLRPPRTTRGGRTAHISLALARGAEGREGSSRAGIGGPGTSDRYTGDLNPAVGLSSRVDSESKIAVLNPWSSQSGEMPSGGIKDSTTKDSPVIPFTRSSSSSPDRLVPGPRWTRPRSFKPVNQQLRRALACSGTARSRRPRASTSDHRSPGTRSCPTRARTPVPMAA
jgi:hypothetical protein